jgi:hypothetical protein
MYGSSIHRERETRSINHTFLGEVYVWYSESEDVAHGHRIYESASGSKFKGTIHTNSATNPYPKSIKDAQLIGYAITLYEMVDVSITTPSPIHSGFLCDAIGWLDLMYHTLFLPERKIE